MNGPAVVADNLMIDQNMTIRMNKQECMRDLHSLDTDTTTTTFKIARAPPRKSHFPGVTVCASCCQSGCSFVMESVAIQCAGCSGLYVEQNAFTIVKLGADGTRQRRDDLCRRCNPHLNIPASARIYCHDCMEEKRDRKRRWREEQEQEAGNEMKKMFL